MAKVFLSYDRDDTERASPVALALEKAGHFVWWDLHIRGGEQFSKVIDEALQAADAVVVLWSKHSIESPWVRDEAAVGRDSGRLIPVSLDEAKPPLGFRQYQTIDLSSWKGRGRPAALQSLFDDVEALAKPTPTSPDAHPAKAPNPAKAPKSTSPKRALPRWIIAPAAALLLAIVAFFGWKQFTPTPKVPSVAIEASGQSEGDRALARDLFVKLGSLQASNAGAVRLLGADSSESPTLVFEVGGDATAADPHANLVLLNGKDRSLYWSREFFAPVGHAADLRQQLGYTAASIIGCVTEGLNKEGRPLKQDTLKLYLNACATYAETGGSNPELSLPMFRQVTELAPDFAGGWGGLLLSETESYRSAESVAVAEQLRAQVRRDIESARQADPHILEAFIAEIDLLPPGSYAERIGLANRAVELRRDKPTGYAARSGVLMGVGRMSDAIDDAHKAVQLDPLSPILRDFYIQALLYGGRMDAALQELKEAERLWPGASTLEGVRFRINLRYGDAREALKALGSGGLAKGWMGAEAYLEARVDPSPANVERAVQSTLAMYRQNPASIGHLAQVWGEFGKEKELLPLLLTAPQRMATSNMEVMFRPPMLEFWHDPRSLQVAKRTGLLQFWQSSGLWPDFCERPDLPYDCKKEAAKLLA